MKVLLLSIVPFILIGECFMLWYRLYCCDLRSVHWGSDQKYWPENTVSPSSWPLPPQASACARFRPAVSSPPPLSSVSQPPASAFVPGLPSPDIKTGGQIRTQRGFKCTVRDALIDNREKNTYKYIKYTARSDWGCMKKSFSKRLSERVLLSESLLRSSLSCLSLFVGKKQSLMQ